MARAACFALPLMPHRLVTACLALGGLAALHPIRPRVRFSAKPLAFVSLGWLLAWLLRPGRDNPGFLVDQMLIGPALALIALGLGPRRLAGDILRGGLVAAAIALFQGIAGMVTPIHWTGVPSVWSRVFGTLRNPNILAAYLAAVVPFAAAARWPLSGKALALSSLGAALLATASRGGWMAGAAALAYWAWRCRPDLLPLCLSGAAAALFLPAGPGQRALAALKGTDTTASSRIAIWKAAIDAWLARPLAGWGAQQPDLAGGAHPHNFLMEILVRGGLAAAAGFLPVASAWYRAASRPGSADAAAAAAAVLALAIFGLWDAVLLHPALSGLGWLCLGLALREAKPACGRYGGNG